MTLIPNLIETAIRAVFSRHAARFIADFILYLLNKRDCPDWSAPPTPGATTRPPKQKPKKHRRRR